MTSARTAAKETNYNVSNASCSSERVIRSIAGFSIILKWQIHVINSIQCSSISILVNCFGKKIANLKTLARCVLECGIGGFP